MAAAEELFATATGEAVRSEEALALEKQLLRCLLKEIILASKVGRGQGGCAGCTAPGERCLMSSVSTVETSLLQSTWAPNWPP